MERYVAVAGWVFALLGWALAAVFAILFFMVLYMKQERRDADGLCRYYEKRLKDIARAG